MTRATIADGTHTELSDAEDLRGFVLKADTLGVKRPAPYDPTTWEWPSWPVSAFWCAEKGKSGQLHYAVAGSTGRPGPGVTRDGMLRLLGGATMEPYTTMAEGRKQAPVPQMPAPVLVGEEELRRLRVRAGEGGPGNPPPRHLVRFFPGYDDTHVEVRDAWLRVVLATRGLASAELPPGLYEFTFTPNSRFERPVSQLVSVDRDLEASPGSTRPLTSASYPWPPPA